MAEPKATAILLSYDRLQNLQQIADSLLSQEFVGEVICWNNNSAEDLKWLVETGVPVYTAGYNLYTWARFVAAMYCAKHDWIITQDDDYLIHNWPAIWEARDPDRIVAALDRTHRNIHDKQSRWGGCHEVLLGWGSVFRRELIPLALHPYIATHGIDQILLRKADRLFGIMLGREHKVLPAIETRLHGCAGTMALYRRGDHQTMTRIARERALELML